MLSNNGPAGFGILKTKEEEKKLMKLERILLTC
jgi:hypothetical protein